MVAILTVAAFPLMTGPASAQSLGTHDIHIDLGTVGVRVNGTLTQFADTYSRVVVNYSFYNDGGPVENVPIHAWIHNWDTATGMCWKVDFPDGSNERTWQNGTFSYTLPPDMPDGEWFVRVRANTEGPGGTYRFNLQDRALNEPNTCPSPPFQQAAPIGDDATDNEAFGYFVKGQRINYAINKVEWCDGSRSSIGCPTIEDPRTYETTSALGNTHFRAVIINNGTWDSFVDYGGACNNRGPTPNGANVNQFRPRGCPDFPFSLNVTIDGPRIGSHMPTWFRHSGEESQEESEPARTRVWKTSTWSLFEKAGNYTVTTRLTARDDWNATDNQNATWAFVNYADFAPEIGSGFKTNATDPYVFSDTTVISGEIIYRNLGPRAIADGENRNIQWRAYIDDPQGNHFKAQDETNVVGANSSWWGNVSWTLSTEEGTNGYLNPGQHTLFVEIDYGDSVFESNETNNRIEIPIYIEDDALPTFLNETASTWFEKDIGITGARPYERFITSIYVEDQDQSSLSVVANFTTTKENVTVTKRYPMSQALTGNPGEYWGTVVDLPHVGNGTTTDYTLVVEATDSAGNKAVSGARSFRITVWPLHTLEEENLVWYPAQNASFDYHPTLYINFTTFLRESITGVHRNHMNASNLELTIVPPIGDNVTYAGAEDWPRYQCQITDTDTNLPNPDDYLPDQEEEEPGEDERGINDPNRPQCPLDGMFRVYYGPDAPGEHRAVWRFLDVSGMARYVNQTFTVVDQLPEIRNVTLSTEKVTSNSSFIVSARVFDDFAPKTAYANFTRADGYSANFTLADPVTPEGSLSSWFNLTITTGRYQMMGNGGTYRLRVDAVDQNGNWASLDVYNGTTIPLVLVVEDTESPTLLGPGVTPNLQEVENNVTFYARALDDTNVTVQLRVKPRGTSENVIGPVNMTEGLDGNFTYTTSFANQNDYEWSMQAVDSVGAKTDPVATGVLTIRQNLGPRFEIRAPGAVIDGERYGRSTPRIELFVYDNDGVDNSTFTFKVNGENVTFAEAPAPAGREGSVLSYTVPQSGRFLHGARVEVNLTAIDLSAEQLTGYHNFSFRVDDRGPTVDLAGFAPAHRADDLHTWNVSLDTRFSFTASDEDLLPTKVDSIRFRVYALGQASSEVVYSGPFRLADLQGLTPRPGTYQIQFYAEDSVGNTNEDTKTITVYLDATPPSPDPYGAKPNGRDISMSLIDDRAGMGRAVVWHRINNASYTFTSMEEDGSVWRAQLPEGRKGDRIAYYVQAWDLVNNTATFGTPDEPLDTYTVPNHKPTLNITAPLQGDTLSRRVDVRWDSTDADGDALIFTISLRAPGSQAFAEISRIESQGTRRYALDTNAYGDGDYTLRISVTDGQDAETKDVSFSIRNKAGAIGTVAADKKTMLPGEGTLITAEITKADPIRVEARVYRDDALVNAYPMRDDGESGDVAARDGLWSVIVKFDDAGDYRVTIFTTYREDGIEKNATQDNSAVFSVALTPGYILTEYAPLVSLIALAAAAAIGVAGYMAFRRRR